MRVIPPLAVTPAILTSSTCAEPSAGETAYNAGTSYALDAVVVVAADHRTYQSLQAGNVGHPPISSPTWWLDIGPTNRWKMFDLLRNTQTEQASPLTVVLTPGVRVDSLALLGLVGDSVTVAMTNGGTTVYTHTEDLNTRDVLDWYDYFFLPFGNIPSLVLFDLPPYSGGVITVDITAASGNAKCGSLVVGSNVFIGDIRYNAESDALNFSTVERDAFGNSTLIPRRSVPKTTQEILCKKDRINKARDLRTALNAMPAVWSGINSSSDGYYEAFLILGYYRRFLINMAYACEALITLDLEEI
jgi:hypothetical protein